MLFVALLAAWLASAAAADPGKLRGGLDAVVAGAVKQDPRIASLGGLQAGEVAYFALLSAPNDAAHAAALSLQGARVLRTYRSTSAYALASSRAAALKVAALPWVRWLTPVEVVTVLGHDAVPDQARATSGDIGAPGWWNLGVTGAGVRIAVLDTGLDPGHPDLDDLDFRHWSSPLPNATKVVSSRSFLNGACSPGTQDGHGHGTHVAGVATGTAEGAPVASDDGRYAGIAPDSELAVGKVMTDAGAGINSDLVAALEWAALPSGTGPLTCPSVGAQIVNLSLGSDSRPARLNSGSDVDFVSYVANRLAVQYGTTIVAAVGNSGPFIGSALETPGSAAQVLSVGATAKNYDLNHDDTLSGDTCAGYLHPESARNDCSAGVGTQPASIASFSSRGPSGDLWLRPDVAAPGYNIVAPQASTGVALAQNDLNKGSRGDPLYATATGTSMASPAAAGTAALLLHAYRRTHGAVPSGGSGVAGLRARSYALLRAALMNTAGTGLHEGRWILTVDGSTKLVCPSRELDVILFGFCSLGLSIPSAFTGSLTLYEVRNGLKDRYVGPLAEGAGRMNLSAAIQALRYGVVAYSAASGAGEVAGTGPRDFQGSWQVGVLPAGTTQTQRFVLHAAPHRGGFVARFAFDPGRPSDGSRAITPGAGAWGIALPSQTWVPRGGDAYVSFTVSAPANAVPGSYTGSVVVTVAGQILRIPVYAAVPLHDTNRAWSSYGPQGRVTSAKDVFAKGETSWPYAGTPGTGSSADWHVYPVQIAAGSRETRFVVYGVNPTDDTYDLYVYDSELDLVASSHPFAAPGVTDVTANGARGPSTSAAPQVVTLARPTGGTYYVAVSRARLGASGAGSFGAFFLRVDELG
ncbi:MAG: S8 family serine peptidase [Gaiellaceae bacterium]